MLVRTPCEPAVRGFKLRIFLGIPNNLKICGSARVLAA